MRHAATNPGLEFLERAGFVARGLLYLVMGLLALNVAIGLGGKNTDLAGSLVFVTGNAYGKVILIAMVVGLLAYSVWGFVRAVFDPLHRGHDAIGLAERAGYLTSALSYLAISMFGLQLLGGSGPSAGDSTQRLASSLLTVPAGYLLTVAIGLASVGVGLGQFFEAYRATFKRDMKRSEMGHTQSKLTDFAGRFGLVSRGVTFSLMGLFLVAAGLHRDPSRARGFGGVFAFIQAQPAGRMLLGLVALGFIALGIHSVSAARYARLMGSGN